MKKTLIYFTIFLFLYNSMGYYFMVGLNRYMARHEMQSLIYRRPSNPIVLEIADLGSDRDFKRIDQREFMYKGTMYDIVREIRTGHKTVFICMRDTKETKLFTGLKRVNQNKVHPAGWIHLVMIFDPGTSIDLNPLLSGNNKFRRVEVPLLSTLLSRRSPPPEFL